MSVEHGSGPISEEAEKAQMEYRYAAGKEGVNYGEQPQAPESYNEAEAFVKALGKLNPNWEELDFSRVDFGHMNSLPDDEQRISYVVEQVMSNQPKSVEKTNMTDRLTAFLRNYPTIRKFTGATAATAFLATMGGVIGREIQQDVAARAIVSQAMDKGQIRFSKDYRPSLVGQTRLADWIVKHPEATLDVTRANRDVDALSDQGSCDVEITITEHGKTQKVHGHGEIHENLFPKDTEHAINSTILNNFASEREAEQLNANREKSLGNYAERRAITDALNHFERGPQE